MFASWQTQIKNHLPNIKFVAACSAFATVTKLETELDDVVRTSPIVVDHHRRS